MLSLKKCSTYKSTLEQKKSFIQLSILQKISMMKPFTSKLFHIILKAVTTKVQINQKLLLLLVNSKLILAHYYSDE